MKPMRTFLRAKIHGAIVTGIQPDYEGSIALGPELMHQVGIKKYEQVYIYNPRTGSVHTTYALKGEPGMVEGRGASARRMEIGDSLIICCYGQYPDEGPFPKPSQIVL